MNRPAWYCRPCALNDRRTVRHVEERPEDLCGSRVCRRVEWVCRSWYCIHCSRLGRTEILYAHDRPDVECDHCHHRAWHETDWSVWALGPPEQPCEECSFRWADERAGR